MSVRSTRFDSIMYNRNAIPGHSAFPEQPGKFSANSDRRITPPQRPTIELLIELGFCVLGGVAMVKRYPPKLLSSEKRDKEMRLCAMRLYDVRPKIMEYSAQGIDGGEVEGTSFRHNLDRNVQTASFRDELIARVVHSISGRPPFESDQRHVYSVAAIRGKFKYILGRAR
jgi:hypothetical protein